MKRCWVIAISVLAVLMVAGVVVMSITRWGWAWTGVVGYKTPQLLDNQEFVPGKTLWDLLALLIVPAALAGIAWWFSNRERKDDREAAEKRAKFDREAADKRAQTERDIATDRLQEAALQAYYDKMTEMLLEKNLREAEEGEEVISIARSRTLATLRSLDGIRKGMLIEFLCEVKLIEKEQTIIDLSDADLEYAELDSVDLIKKNLRWTRMTNAILRRAMLRDISMIGACLREADLSFAGLSGADLSGADLKGADLSGADLSGANLREADLSSAYLNWANLSGADLCGADLSGADLKGADLFRSNLIFAKGLSSQQLAEVINLRGTIMMDGETYDRSRYSEIANLRKEAGLDDGNMPPDDIKLWGTIKDDGDRLGEDTTEEAGEGGGEAGG